MNYNVLQLLWTGKFDAEPGIVVKQSLASIDPKSASPVN